MDYTSRPQRRQSRLSFSSHAIIWSLCFLIGAPPSLMAQAIGTTAPQGVNPMPWTAPTANPDQPVMTHPNALQPITPAQAPCPTPGSSAPPAPGLQLVGTPPAKLGGSFPGGLPPGISLPAQPPSGASLPSASQGGPAQQTTASLPTHPGLLNPVIQQQSAEGPGALPRQLQPEGVGQLSIEEAFSRFFILQGVAGQLKQFGYSFFDAPFSGMPPTMDVPVGPDYVLGPDDTLALHIWNAPQASLNRSYIAPVERDGVIFVPQVGAIPVAGTTLSQATRLIHGRLNGLLKHFDLHVSMARLRTIKVYVVGEVVRPGAYELSSLATASHALYAACGPGKSGSLRKIHVVREGKTISELDFYDFFLQGDRTQDVRLRSGDTILVPPIGAVAAIGGPVKRPGIYELLDRTKLDELIDLAGGLSPTADRKHCQIYRVEAGQQRVIVDVDLSLSIGLATRVSTNGVSGNHVKPMDDGKSSPLIQDGDFVRIAAVPTQIENAVVLAGAVRNPGPFEYRPGMHLRDLLTPEQMLVDSYVDRAELVRTDPLTYEVVVTSFSPRALFQGKEENVELRRLDKVVVATQVKAPRIVSVAGEVQRPGNYTIESGERLSSVLKRAGGLTSRAFPRGIIVIRESVKKKQQEELEKFVALQKQKLIMEAASLSAGNVNPQAGANQDQVTLQIQMQALDQLASRVQPGRVVVKMESLEELENGLEDIRLEEGDSITMPQRPQTVTVLGAVRNPTSVVAYPGLRVEDYLRQAGGVTKDASEKEMYILRADGSTEAAYVRLKDVNVGDTIVVPQLVEPKTRPLPFWQSIASIVGSMMMGVAAVAIIGR